MHIQDTTQAIGATPTQTQLLTVKDVKVEFRQPRSIGHWLTRRSPAPVRAVNSVSLTIHELETVGLVGESGSGKTTLGRAVMQIYRPTQGTIHYRQRAIADADPDWQRRLRREIQMVFQDPYSSLNPRMSIGQTLAEVLRFHHIVPEIEIRAEVERLMQQVGLNANMGDRLPRQLSGGQRQRVGLARSLAVRPSLLVLDEPVAALDVSIQAQILNLLKDLQAELGLTMLFVAHDLSVVKHVSDRVAVMYRGELVEMGSKREIFSAPRHPYTQSLLSAVPKLTPHKRQRQSGVMSDVGSPSDSGCLFYNRCPIAQPICASQVPANVQVSDSHKAKCHFAV